MFSAEWYRKRDPQVDPGSDLTFHMQAWPPVVKP